MTASDDIEAVAAMLTEGLSDQDRLSLALSLLPAQTLPNEIPHGTVCIDAPGHGHYQGNPRVYLKNERAWHCSNGAAYLHADLDDRIRHRRSAVIIHIPLPRTTKPEDDFDFEDLLDDPL